MKKLIIGCFLILITIFTQAFAQDLGGFTIDDYKTSITVQPDGSLDVSETIDVNFSEPRRGIYRTIPTSNQGWPRAIENFQAEGDTYIDQSDGSFYKIRIGDANITHIGPKTYKISYHVKNGIRYINESGQSRQELYWNIVGNDRDTTINNVDFLVFFASGLELSGLDHFAYYGNYGDRLTGGLQISFPALGTMQGSLSTQLQPRQALTVGIKLPSDYIKITPEYEAMWNEDVEFNENHTTQVTPGRFWTFFSIMFFLPFLVAIGLVSKGRKSIKKIFGAMGGQSGYRSSDKPATIEYLPPEGYSLPQVAMFYHYADNPQIMSALVYYWANKGRVTVQEVETGFRIFKGYEYRVTETSNDPQGATQLDKELLQDFFGMFDQTLDSINLEGASTYKKVARVFRSLDTYTESQNRFTREGGFFFSSQKLTPEGEVLYEKLRGYMTYLDKVERPVLEQFIKDDPNYIDKILPWAALFGLDSKLCEKVKDLLKQPDRYSGTRPFTYTTFGNMNNSFVSAATPPSQSSSGGGFGGSSGGGSSGGGGGGGGGGSW